MPINNFWDERYSIKDYVYGTLPNEFFKEQIDKLKPGKIKHRKSYKTYSEKIQNKKYGFIFKKRYKISDHLLFPDVKDANINFRYV